MKRFFSKSLALVALVGALTAFSTSKAEAAFFTGTIDYTGSHTSDVLDLTVATQSTISNALVTSTTGSFSVIPDFTLLTHATPLVYRPATPPAGDLWSDAGSGIAFQLLTMSIGPGNTAQSLTLTGTGVFHGGGFQGTPGTWIMTLNNAGVVTKGSYSASQAATVPEPVTLSLLGLGLAGAAIRARRRQA